MTSSQGCFESHSLGLAVNRKSLSNNVPSFIVCRTVSTQPHEQRPQIGRRGSFRLASRATLATTAEQ